MTKNPRLHPARCPSCQQVLVHAPAGSSVYCPDCKTWTLARPETTKPTARRSDKALKRYETKSMEQLTLFP